jgi:FAD synthase
VSPSDFTDPVKQRKLPCGVYYGFSQLEEDSEAQRMVMSLGTNPHYNNEEKTLVRKLLLLLMTSQEIHVLKTYPSTFYDKRISFCIVGWIRSMTPFDSVGKITLPSASTHFSESLIKAIENDISFANERLASHDLAEMTEKLSDLLKPKV